MYKKSQFILTFSIFIDHLGYKMDLFWYKLTFSIQSGHDLIDFVTTIKNLDPNLSQIFDWNPKQLWNHSNFYSRLIASLPKLTKYRLLSWKGYSYFVFFDLFSFDPFQWYLRYNLNGVHNSTNICIHSSMKFDHKNLLKERYLRPIQLCFNPSH